MAADPPPLSGRSGQQDDPDAVWRPPWDERRPPLPAAPDPAPAGSPAAPSGQAPSGPAPTGPVRRWLPLAALLVSVAAVVAAVVVLASTPSADDRADAPAPATSAGPPTTGPVTADELAAVRQAVSTLDAAAGGSPDAQRQVLRTLVDPARTGDLDGCAAPTTTVRLEPAWQDVRRAADGHLLVPALVRIFTGSRITGTDVALVDVRVSAGRALLPPLCVS